ncbi:MAG: transposase [Phycisphaeraceae bacterium]|nr:transposase [Phycisphaeraceae bacterium]
MPKPHDVSKDTQVKPDPALEKRTRRSFTTQYKLNILSQVEQCQRGEIGALLRREKLYASQLSDWRKERDRGDLDALAKTQPGPRAKLSPEQKRIAQLEKQLVRLTRQIQIKDDCLELQKKAMQMLDQIERSGQSQS